MNFGSLQRLEFLEPNPENQYVSWTTTAHPTMPRWTLEELTDVDCHRVIQAKTRIDRVVHHALLDYVNNEALRFDDDLFPQASRLTGNYYVAAEGYRQRGDEIQGHVEAHLTEMFGGGVTETPVEMDYLGLEVWFTIAPDGSIAIDGIDSSSI